MRVGTIPYKKMPLTVLLLLTFTFSFLPISVTAKAEELAESPIEQIELEAEIRWNNLPDDLNAKTQVHLMEDDRTVESIEIDSSTTRITFGAVDKLDGSGNEIPYHIEQEPIENFKTTIEGMTVTNTYQEPVQEEPPAEEAPPAEEPPAEEPPAEEPPAEEPPAEEPPAEEPPAVESPAVEPPAVEPPAEEPPAVESPAVEPPAVEPLAEEPPAVESPAVEPPTEEPPAEQLPAEEPPAEEPPAEEAPSAVETTSSVELIEEGSLDVSSPQGSDRVIPGSVQSNEPVILDLSKTKSRSLTSSNSTSMELMAITSPTNPGEVTIDKYAEPVPGLVNVWDVTLRIEGMDSEKSSDIVLVIDRSGSMAGTKLTNAKAAAVDFVEAMADEPNTRIALVSFASAYKDPRTGRESTTYTKHTTDLLDLSNAANVTTLTNTINGLYALGGTNTQAGIMAAMEYLVDSPADQKNIVLLSDGEPTQSYAINNVASKLTDVTDYDVTNDIERYQDGRMQVVSGRIAQVTRNDLIATDFDYNTTVGYGGASYLEIARRQYDTDSEGRPLYEYDVYSHANSAIAQAAMFKNLGVDRTLWTIALETTAFGNQVLNSIASPGCDYTGSAADLNTIFMEIAGSIRSAARNVSVVDPMGPGFEIPAANVSEISVSQGSASYTDGIISWNVGNLNDPISEGSAIKYAEMTYRVSITDDILDEEPDEFGCYPTNGDAEVTYLNSASASITEDFPIPKVNPIFLKVKKILLDANGDPISGDTREFSINILSSARPDLPFEGYGQYNNTFVLSHNETEETTGLRLADTYTITEPLPLSVTTDYDVTIKVNGTVTETSTFTVLPPTGSPLDDSGQNDILVEVTNQEKPLGKLILKKILKDPTGADIVGDLTEFTFTITGPITPGVFDGEETRTLKGGDTVNIEGLRYGTYTVTETNPVTGYTVSSVPVDGIVTLSCVNKEGIVTITNTQSTTNVVISKFVTGNMGDRSKNFTFTATLTNASDEAINFPAPPGDSGYDVSGNVATFDLMDEESVTLLNIPIGSKLTIKESDNAGYTVYIDDAVDPDEDSEVTFVVPAAGKTITFTNDKEAIIDTGVGLDTLPYMLLLLLVSASSIGGLICKNTHTDFMVRSEEYWPVQKSSPGNNRIRRFQVTDQIQDQFWKPRE